MLNCTLFPSKPNYTTGMLTIWLYEYLAQQTACQNVWKHTIHNNNFVLNSNCNINGNDHQFYITCIIFKSAPAHIIEIYSIWLVHGHCWLMTQLYACANIVLVCCKLRNGQNLLCHFVVFMCNHSRNNRFSLKCCYQLCHWMEIWCTNGTWILLYVSFMIWKKFCDDDTLICLGSECWLHKVEKTMTFNKVFAFGR